MLRIPTLHITKLRLPFGVLSCALLAACGGRGEAGEPFAARDSAGVRIAESRAPAWAPGEEWTVGATPLADVTAGREPFRDGGARALSLRTAGGRSHRAGGG
jgi:hypothetical protein